MRIEYKSINADIEIFDMLTFHGEIHGNVTVKQGALFILQGVIVKNLVIEKDARAVLHGLVCGDVTNLGKLEIFGVVSGLLNDPYSNTIIHPNAQVNQ